MDLEKIFNMVFIPFDKEYREKIPTPNSRRKVARFKAQEDSRKHHITMQENKKWAMLCGGILILLVIVGVLFGIFKQSTESHNIYFILYAYC